MEADSCDRFSGFEASQGLARQMEFKARTALTRRSNSGQLPNPSESPQGRTLAAGELDTDAAAEVERLQKQNEALEMQLLELRVAGSCPDPSGELALENKRLREENQRLTEELKRLSSLSSGNGTQDHSESRLRSALTRQGTTTSELRQAINAVESLVDEARRELNNAMLRERRAAFEALHSALDRQDEQALEEAIEKARLADVEVEDIAKGEAKLAELRSQTPEQKAAKAARELESKAKKEAFVLIKKDNPEALEELIKGLAEGVRWQDWRDYAGRSLWKCSLDLRAFRTQSYLAPLLGMALPEETKPGKRPSKVGSISGLTGASGDTPPQRPVRKSSNAVEALDLGEPMSRQASSTSPSAAEAKAPPSPASTPSVVRDNCAAGPGRSELDVDSLAGTASEGLLSPSPLRSSIDDGDPATAGLRAKAMRAVAQDDCAGLAEVLEAVHQDVWTTWQNKAGKDLLTLSMERGSSLAYSMLARELGMLKELAREAFEERESVWVFEAGEVQPKRATVLEDTPAEAEEILIEFWDGDTPPERVERCLVRKMFQ